MLAVAALLTILVVLVRTIDKRVVQVRDTPEAGGGQHRRHRADRRDRQARGRGAGRGPQAPPVPRPGARQGEARDARWSCCRSSTSSLLIAGLAFYLFVVGGQLTRVADQPRGVRRASSRTIKGNAELIAPGVEHINRTGGVVAGALPLLYGMAEGIVAGATYQPDPAERPPARPASGRRRSRLHDGVGYAPRQ